MFRHFIESVNEPQMLTRMELERLVNGGMVQKAERVEELFTEYMRKTISIRDTFAHKPTKENFYHGLLLGILGFKEDWSVLSNRKSGDGFSDILIQIEDEDIGIACYKKKCKVALETEESESLMIL